LFYQHTCDPISISIFVRCTNIKLPFKRSLAKTRRRETVIACWWHISGLFCLVPSACISIFIPTTTQS